MDPAPPRVGSNESSVPDATHNLGDLIPSPTGMAMSRAVAVDPDDERAWARLTGWLTDNGHDDEAEAVQVFWPVIADSIRSGRPLAEVMRHVRRHPPAIDRLARRLDR